MGPKENSLKYTALLQKYKHLEVVDFEQHYTLCLTSDIVRHGYHDIPDGEWMCWLDSDWRVPQISLDMIQAELTLAEEEGSTALFSFQLAHDLNPLGDLQCPAHYNTIERNNEIIEKRMQNWTVDGGCYGWPIIVKVNKKSMWCDSVLENHGFVLPVPYIKRVVPRMYHLHIRDFGRKEYCNTMTYQCWWFLGHHIFTSEETNAIVNSYEYKAIEAFKLKYQCFTSNMFDSMINTNPLFKKELTELFLSFKESTFQSANQMYMMASEYNMEFTRTVAMPECKSNCCIYKTHEEYV